MGEGETRRWVDEEITFTQSPSPNCLYKNAAAMYIRAK
jgi:hypothetical protein